MNQDLEDRSPVSHWWRQAVILVMILGFSLLTLVTVKTYAGAPPIPAQVVDTAGHTLFTGADIKGGQEVFLKSVSYTHLRQCHRPGEAGHPAPGPGYPRGGPVGGPGQLLRGGPHLGLRRGHRPG